MCIDNCPSRKSPTDTLLNRRFHSRNKLSSTQANPIRLSFSDTPRVCIFLELFEIRFRFPRSQSLLRTLSHFESCFEQKIPSLFPHEQPSILLSILIRVPHPLDFHPQFLSQIHATQPQPLLVPRFFAAPISSAKTHSAIPKAFTDRLMNQETRPAGHTTHPDPAIFLTNLQHEFADLENENATLSERMDAAEKRARKQDDTIAQLVSFMEQNPGGKATKDTDGEDVKKPRDNVFNLGTILLINAVRKAFLMAMGLPKTTKAKDAARLQPTIQHGGYVKDAESGGKKVPKLSSSVAIKEKSDDDILDRLESIFRNMAGEYRNAKKLGASVNDDRNEDAEASGKDETLSKRTNHHKARKIRIR
ncbi:hypothetical protein K438DRAFT_1783567 [Mycena galopus ATCC 62051]|nr:hypothetical protein K438DRAFT_1783567 [Mycena galopus ATCC 62051]